MQMSLRAHLFSLFFSSMFFYHKCTKSRTLGTRLTFFSLYNTVIFRCHIYSISFEFFNPFTMTEESWLLEWYVLLEDQCFMDQLHQSVFSQLLFHKIFKFLTILLLTSLFFYTLIFLLLYLYLGLFRPKFDIRKNCSHSPKGRMLTWA